MICHRRGENVEVATVLQPQSLAEFCHRHGEVPDADVGLCHTSHRLPQFPLVQRGDTLDAELSAGELTNGGVGDEEMAVLSHLPDAVSLLQQ